MRLIFALLTLFLTFFAYSYYKQNGERDNKQDELTVKTDQINKYNITSKLKSYNIGTKTVDVSLAFQYYNADKFRLVQNTNNEFINDGLISSEKWFALPLQNNSDEQITSVLEFIISGVNTVQCYTVNDIQQVNYIPPSANSPKHSSQGLLSKPITMIITTGAGEKNLLLIHTINNGQLLYFPAHLYSLNYFREAESYKNNFFGIFVGIFFFIILFNLIIYFTTFESIYFYYMLYAFLIAVFALNDVGKAPFASFSFINFFSGQTFLLSGFCAWLLLMQHFLKLTKKNFSSLILLQLLAALDVLYAFLPYFFKMISAEKEVTLQAAYQTGFNIVFAVNLLFIISTNLSRIAAKDKLAVFYVLANVPVMLGSVIYYTNYYNITNIQFGWVSPIALGLSMETFVLSFGFAYRFNLIGKEKNQLLWQMNKQQQEVTQQIILVQESERKRIAEDLHDELGSDLATIKINLERLPISKEKISAVMRMLDKASDDVRNISHNLMPPEFTNTRLDELLSTYYRQLNSEGTIRFDFKYSGANNKFSKEDELMIYRIIMEMTNNIMKHAAATEATMQVINYDDHVEIMAEDNGKGISMNNSDGIGLKNIRSRVDFLHGTLQIDSNEHGTTIVVQIPYKTATHAT